MNLAELLDQYGDAIARTVIESYPPLYDAEVRRSASADLRRLLRRPLGAQADAINATALSLKQSSGTFVVGEMGTGKSYIAAAAAYLAGCRRVLVVSPPHLVKKWRREVEQTVPGARRHDRADDRRSGAPEDAVGTIDSSSSARASGRSSATAGCRPWSIDRSATRTEVLPAATMAASTRSLCCPTCFAPVDGRRGRAADAGPSFGQKKRRCRACGGSLWQADRTGPRRVPLADYVRRRMPGYFDLLILDEGHEYKARGSAQGLAAESLAGACAKTLTLTGTLFGGYSSTLFYLLWRFSPAVRREFGYRDEAKWISRYGIVERVTKKDSDAYGDDGRHSKRRSYLTRTVEKPGVSPSVLFHLIGNTVFLRLSDVASDLPTYTEQVVICDARPGRRSSVAIAGECYQRLARDLRQATVAALSCRLQTTARGLPPGAARLPGCLHARRDGASTRRPGASSPMRRRCPTTRSIRRSGRWWTWRSASGRVGGGCWSTSPTPSGATSAHACERSSSEPGFDVAVLKADTVARRSARRVARGTGARGSGGADLPPTPRADRTRPHRLAVDLLVRDRVQRLRHAPG